MNDEIMAWFRNLRRDYGFENFEYKVKGEGMLASKEGVKEIAPPNNQEICT